VVVTIVVVFRLALFAVFDSFVLADFITDCSCARTYSAADKGTFTASGESTDHGATSG